MKITPFVALLLASVWLALASPGLCQSLEIQQLKTKADMGDTAALKALAEQGDTDAQLELATQYQMDNNMAEAAKWTRKAAEQGDADAQSFLGDYYLRGVGVEKDYAEALKWIRLSAEMGNGYGQRSLGQCFLDGKGIAKDSIEAYAWLNLAASAPLSVGQVRQLAGIADERIHSSARKAFQSSNDMAAKARDALEKVMRPDQVAEAQKRTKELRSQIEARLKTSAK